MKQFFSIWILWQIGGFVFSQAPGDEDDFCTQQSSSIFPPIYPSNFKSLMDSYNYIQLIPTNVASNAVWQQVDLDYLTNTTNNDPKKHWIQSSSSACRQIMYSCSTSFTPPAQNNWLITQHISREVNGSLLPQVSVLVEFELEGCNSGCQKSYLVEVWETSNIDQAAARNTSQYRRVKRVPPLTDSGLVSQNASIQVDFKTNETGFYLAFVDDNTCIAITRVIVFYYVCPAMTDDLIVYPETISPPINCLVPQTKTVAGQCVRGAVGELKGSPSLLCIQAGVWKTLQENTKYHCCPGIMLVDDAGHDNNNSDFTGTCTGEMPTSSSSCQQLSDSWQIIVYGLLSAIIVLLLIALLVISSCYILAATKLRRLLKDSNNTYTLYHCKNAEPVQNPSYGVQTSAVNKETAVDITQEYETVYHDYI